MNKSTRFNNQNKILIITGGCICEEFLKSLVLNEQYTIIIVADKGLLAAYNLGLEVDFILGDFDSVPANLLSEYKNSASKILRFPSKKDKTDTEIALELALEQKPGIIDLIGATGSRMDHTMANIHLLMPALEQRVNAKILDPNNKIYLKNQSFTIKKDEQYGDYISLLPFSSKIEELTLRGFKYPLDGITLRAGSSLAISNEIMDEVAYVEFKEGILVVFETRD